MDENKVNFIAILCSDVWWFCVVVKPTFCHFRWRKLSQSGCFSRWLCLWKSFWIWWTSDLKQSSMGNGSKKHYKCQTPCTLRCFGSLRLFLNFWKNNIWRGIPRWCLSFVPWNTFLNMVQETTSTQLWLVIVKLPSFYECHEHSALPSPFGRNEHLKCLSSYIFTHSDQTL